MEFWERIKYGQNPDLAPRDIEMLIELPPGEHWAAADRLAVQLTGNRLRVVKGFSGWLGLYWQERNRIGEEAGSHIWMNEAEHDPLFMTFLHEGLHDMAHRRPALYQFLKSEISQQIANIEEVRKWYIQRLGMPGYWTAMPVDIL